MWSWALAVKGASAIVMVWAARMFVALALVRLARLKHSIFGVAEVEVVDHALLAGAGVVAAVDRSFLAAAEAHNVAVEAGAVALVEAGGVAPVEAEAVALAVAGAVALVVAGAVALVVVGAVEVVEAEEAEEVEEKLVCHRCSPVWIRYNSMYIRRCLRPHPNPEEAGDPHLQGCLA